MFLYERFRNSRFFDNNIIVFTFDHGEMLGAHGGMQPHFADLISTILGLAGVDVEAARRKLEMTHTETRALAGRDLSSLVMGAGSIPSDRSTS